MQILENKPRMLIVWCGDKQSTMAVYRWMPLTNCHVHLHKRKPELRLMVKNPSKLPSKCHGKWLLFGRTRTRARVGGEERRWNSLNSSIWHDGHNSFAMFFSQGHLQRIVLDVRGSPNVGVSGSVSVSVSVKDEIWWWSDWGWTVGVIFLRFRAFSIDLSASARSIAIWL